jgi:hypothetical protein
VGSRREEQRAGERPAPGDRARAVPAARMPAAERHALALRQSLRVAQHFASVGDYDRALAWLGMIEFIERELPERWQAARAEWRAARDAQAHERKNRP